MAAGTRNLTPRVLLSIVLICGLLDATAVVNTGAFGIGAYIAASALAALVLVIRARAFPAAQEGMPTHCLKPAVFCIVVMWLLACIQIWLQIGIPTTLFTQTMVRTIIIGHMLICVILITAVNDQRLVSRVLLAFLFVYVAYGLYDFVAQVLGYPRFLNALRNSESVAISQSAGAQGWIKLPRLSSLSAEPSHTTLLIALTLFLAVRLRRLRKYCLITLAILFAIGTFARTLWLSMAGAIGLCTFLWVLNRLRLPYGKRVSELVVVGSAVALPVLACLVPLMVSRSPGEDLSAMERFDTSRAAFLLFSEHPLLGVGFFGWLGQTQRFTDVLIAPASAVVSVHNGMAVYLAALGVAGLVLVYTPLLLIVRSAGLSDAAKGWWVAAYSMALIGGDYIALPSTWTVMAVVSAWAQAAVTERRDS